MLSKPFEDFLVRMAYAIARSSVEEEAVFNHILYQPPIKPPAALARNGYSFLREFREDAVRVRQDGTELGLWVRPPDDATKPVYVVFHGRHGHWERAGLPDDKPDDSEAVYRLEWLKQIAATGAGIIAVHMRCHGSSRHPNDRRIGEKRFGHDIRAIADYLREHHTDGRRVIIAGESMGGALATMLAEEMTHPTPRQRGEAPPPPQPPAVLGLINTFASMDDMIHLHMKRILSRGPFKPDTNITSIIHNHLDTAKRIRRLQPQHTRLYIARAVGDEHIPPDQHEKLCAAAGAAGFSAADGSLKIAEWQKDDLWRHSHTHHTGWDHARVVSDLQALNGDRHAPGMNGDTGSNGRAGGNGRLLRDASPGANGNGRYL